MRRDYVSNAPVAGGSIVGPITLAGDVTGASNANLVKRSPGAYDGAVTYAQAQLTVGSDNVIYQSQIAANLGNDPVNDNGTHWKVFAGTPAVIVGTDCQYATAAALSASTYANGASGVGATLTKNTNGALSVDGASPIVGDRILVKNQATAAQNGVYSVTATGSGGAPFVLTRVTDFDQAAEILQGTTFAVLGGSTLINTSWVLATSGTITVGTTSLTFSANPTLYSAGKSLALSGRTISYAPVWSASFTYIAGDILVGSDGNQYRSQQAANTNHDPTTDTGTWWKLYWVTGNTTLAVGAAARFTAPLTAYAFVREAFIPDNVIVTITLADGNYNLTTGWYISSPCGGRIFILGNTSTPANVTLTFTNDTEGIVVGLAGADIGTKAGPGCALGMIDGVKIIGQWPKSGTTYASRLGICALNGSVVTCGSHIIVDKFYYGFAALYGSTMYCSGTTVTNAGDASYWSYDNSFMQARSCTASGASDPTNSLGYGYVAELGGVIQADGSTATTHAISGFAAFSGGGIRANAIGAGAGFTSNSNTGNGLMLVNSWFQGSGPCECKSNTGSGVVISAGSRFHLNTSASATSSLDCSSNGANGFITSESTARIQCAFTSSSNTLTGLSFRETQARIDGNTILNSNGAGGLFAEDGSTVKIVGDLTTGDASGTKNTGVGAAIGYNSLLRVTGKIVSKNNTSHGVWAYQGGQIVCGTTGSDISSNTSTGILAERMSRISLASSVTNASNGTNITPAVASGLVVTSGSAQIGCYTSLTG